MACEGVPRARGDEPELALSPSGLPAAFPAHAGMNRTKTESGATTECVPRARGDEPNAWFVSKALSRRSPRTRG